MNMLGSIEEARRLGFNWVAVDEDKDVFAFKEKPALSDKGVWSTLGYEYGFMYIGHYSGDLRHYDTLREVR